MDYKLLVKDPLAAHEGMRKTHGLLALFHFVQKTVEAINSERHVGSLAVFPRLPNDVNRWKMVAKLLDDRVVFGGGTSEDGEELPKVLYVSKNKYKAHFRSAHLCRFRDGTRGIRLGSLVNRDKLNPEELAGWVHLVDEYNIRVKQKYQDTYEILSMREWMESMGVLI